MKCLEGITRRHGENKNDAKAVVDAFTADYEPLSVDQKIELSRLIVEQFSRKG
jgi:hypothetical protein